MSSQSLGVGSSRSFAWQRQQQRPVAGRCRLPAVQTRCEAATAPTPAVQAEDKWLARNLVPLVSSSGNSAPSAVSALRSSCQAALPSMRMPSTRNEEYRYTDISPLLNASLAIASADAAVNSQQLEQLAVPEAAGSRVVLVNGVFRPELSDLSAVGQEGVFIGSAADAPAEVLQELGQQSNTRGGPFAVLNGSMVADVLVVALPAGAKLQQPLHVLHVSTPAAAAADGSSSGGPVLNASAARLLVSLGANASAEVVEEFVSDAEGSHVSMPVAEVVLGEGSELKHGYVHREASGAQHFKATLVKQAEGSCYELVEARVGGSLTRHDVGVQQDGPDTTTSMKHFVLAGAGQLQDLHSKLVLDHPRGEADQLHKCISSASTARGVFDGNVKVNRLAQKTNAGQLSRNLLLVPKATVNVKPNLQIIADDVKCTHGCAVSDLSDEELFYFRARGVSYEQARQALVYSFGAEVVQQLKHEKLVARIQQDIVNSLKKSVEQLQKEAA